ncbi:hypothetical protein B0T14DRAFT_42333 [Immersiella caudata]|uniref:BHLH domain-containing protein n=1 Tax=Immersiella caudata TaxID=314043 RepID=A0AA39XF18_9PEZI|nr:hypothetical protein B0T14DRAFT_42333 [Immersiella caudata]
MQTLAASFLGYPSTMTFDHTVFPTPLDLALQGPALCFDSSPSSYVESTEGFVFSGHSSALHSPTAIDPVCAAATLAGYDACTSPIESSCSRSTATTPSDDILAGYFAIPAVVGYSAANVSPIAVGGTDWAGCSVHFEYTHSGPPSADFPTVPSASPLAHPHANHGYQVAMGEPFPPKGDPRPEGDSWGGEPVGPTDMDTGAKGVADVKVTTNTRSTVTSRANKPRGRKSSARKEALEDGSLPKPALRTAARKHKQSGSTSKPGESAQAHRARASHNQVEKEYRNRLHGYFERLLKVLPDEGESNKEAQAGRSPSGSASGGSSQHKRLSKAEVLQKARQHIVFLEQDAERRRREIRALKRISICDQDQ